MRRYDKDDMHESLCEVERERTNAESCTNYVFLFQRDLWINSGNDHMCKNQFKKKRPCVSKNCFFFSLFEHYFMCALINWWSNVKFKQTNLSNYIYYTYYFQPCGIQTKAAFSKFMTKNPLSKKLWKGFKVCLFYLQFGKL